MRISAKEIKETVYYGRLQMLNNIKHLFPDILEYTNNYILYLFSRNP